VVAKVEDRLGRYMAAAGIVPSWATADESGPTLTRREKVEPVGGVECFLVRLSADREGFWEREECSIASANDRMSSGERDETDNE
jgi:hypothetical protein